MVRQYYKKINPPALSGRVLRRQVLAPVDRHDERVLVEAVPHGAVQRAQHLVLVVLGRKTLLKTRLAKNYAPKRHSYRV